jgi:F-type H+-transporting ATPase subunit delta
MDQAEKIVDGIIKFLQASGKLDLLPQIISLLEKEGRRLKGENTAVITSAKPLSKEELSEIEKQLIHLFGKKLALVNKIDPEVISGFIIQVSDKVVDLSLNSYLNSFEEKIDNENN